MVTKANNCVLNLVDPPIDNMVLLEGTLDNVTIGSTIPAAGQFTQITDTELASPLVGAPAGLLSQVFLGAGLTMLGNVISVEETPPFPGLQAINGYVKLPGGTIIQWGQAIIPTGNGDVVTLPISFPTAILGIVASDYGNGCHRSGWMQNGSSLSSFLAYAKDVPTEAAITMRYGYIAIGY
jgi:hypothetical protein